MQFLTPCPAHCFFLFKGAEAQSPVAARWAPLPDPRLCGVPEETAQLLLLLMNPKGAERRLQRPSRMQPSPPELVYSERMGIGGPRAQPLPKRELYSHSYLSSCSFPTSWGRVKYLFHFNDT